MRGNIYMYALIVAIIAGSLFFESNISSSQVKVSPLTIQDDDGEMDDFTILANRNIHITKNLDVEVDPSDYNTATLYIYGRVSDCSNGISGKNAILEVGEPEGSEFIQFNPCDVFSEVWGWTTFDIPIDSLQTGINSFTFRNVQHFENFEDVMYIGYDTDTTEYDRSKAIDIGTTETIINPEKLNYDFENMIYLRLS